jgi:hypothetical protein
MYYGTRMVVLRTLPDGTPVLGRPRRATTIKQIRAAIESKLALLPPWESGHCDREFHEGERIMGKELLAFIDGVPFQETRY